MSLSTTAVRIKVTLKDVKPEVMRCLVVPLTLRLDRLHLTLQAAFGWTNSHLFEFLAGEGRWGIPDPDGDFGPQPIDARKARLCDIVQETGANSMKDMGRVMALVKERFGASIEPARASGLVKAALSA